MLRKLALKPLFFFPWKHHEMILWPDEFPDDLKLRLRGWSIPRYSLSQFPNGHLFEAFYKRISLCLLNEKYVDRWSWRILYLSLDFINNVFMYGLKSKDLHLIGTGNRTTSWKKNVNTYQKEKKLEFNKSIKNL